ncbi:MAG TPA: phosphate ABC transporter substrate-binding protein PstS [Xanthobacteraceae bacterium]
MRSKTRLTTSMSGAALAAVAAAAVLLGGTAYAAQTRLLATGSTLLYPLLNLWASDYQKIRPDVQIATQSTGSGTGITEAISGMTQIGASDAYLTNALTLAYPGILNIPLAISSQMVNYNIPGLNKQHLKLSGPVLAGIYRGEVKYWDDPAIAQINPGVTLPHNAIVPVHRTDASGDTFIFTQFLSFSTLEWLNSPRYGITVSWPAVQGAIGADGNLGMVNASKSTPYSIAYIGISFKNATDSAGLGIAELKNRDGEFVLPDQTTVSAALNEMSAKTPADERVSLIFAPGAQSYPIINYEYALVKSHQPNADTAKALREFLSWAINPKGGSAPHYLQAVGFVALPESIVELSNKQIQEIK